MLKEARDLAKELEERVVELEDRLENIDPERIVRKGWASLAQTVAAKVADVEKPQQRGFFHDLIGGLIRRPSDEKDLRPVELFKDLILVFLKGPVDIVLSDAGTEAVETLVVGKVSVGGDLTAGNLSALKRGIDNLYGSALYPLAYKFIYNTFDELAEGLTIKRPDDLPIFPPNNELIEITERLVELRGQLGPLEALIDRGLADPQILADPRYQSDLQRQVEDSEPYREFRRQSKKLTLTVIGSSATDFLKEAIESIPRVEPYLERIQEEVEDDPTVGDRDYVKLLIEAPAYIRVFCYVSDANKEDHVLPGARVAFPVAISEKAGDEFDDMLWTLFGTRATLNPFHSSQRAEFNADYPLKVQQQYEAWREARGLPPSSDPG